VADPRVLIVRPEPGAAATAARARAVGLEPVLCPLFKVSPLAWEAPEIASFDAVLLTSAQAARHGGAQLARYRGLPVYAVGPATAASARAAGFADVCAGQADAAAAVDAMSAHGHTLILHLAGEHHQPPLQGRLKICRRIVYRAAAITPAPLLPDTPVVLVHSARAGARLAELIEPDHRHTRILIAISSAAAAAAGQGWKKIYTATAPNDDALLACAARACKAA
jgi:uroporphyrinogen-III synthase